MGPGGTRPPMGVLSERLHQSNRASRGGRALLLSNTLSAARARSRGEEGGGRNNSGTEYFLGIGCDLFPWLVSFAIAGSTSSEETQHGFLFL